MIIKAVAVLGVGHCFVLPVHNFVVAAVVVARMPIARCSPSEAVAKTLVQFQVEYVVEVSTAANKACERLRSPRGGTCVRDADGRKRPTLRCRLLQRGHLVRAELQRPLRCCTDDQSFSVTTT